MSCENTTRQSVNIGVFYRPFSPIYITMCTYPVVYNVYKENTDLVVYLCTLVNFFQMHLGCYLVKMHFSMFRVIDECFRNVYVFSLVGNIDIQSRCVFFLKRNVHQKEKQSTVTK